MKFILPFAIFMGADAASYDRNKIAAAKTAELELRLSDELLDLDQKVEIQVHGKKMLVAGIPRTAAAIRQTLDERLDLPAAATAVFRLPQ